MYNTDKAENEHLRHHDDLPEVTYFSTYQFSMQTDFLIVRTLSMLKTEQMIECNDDTSIVHFKSLGSRHIHKEIEIS